MDRDELIAWVKESAKGLIGSGSVDMLPHLLLSHGFIEWTRLLPKELKWRGVAKEPNLVFEKYYRTLYDRFFLFVEQTGALDSFTDDEKERLREKGWREYLED